MFSTALVGTALFGAAVTVAAPTAQASPETNIAPSHGWVWPLRPDPALARTFEPPATEYGAGHRGVDLVGTAGAWVRTVDDGVVSFAGDVAGVGVVSVDHGGVVSTYQPVSAQVRPGDVVSAGEPLGHLLSSGTHCAPRSCLHLGRRSGGQYADPLALLEPTSPRIRLMTPYGKPPSPPSPDFGVASAGSGELFLPAGGPVTSPFGMRTHPLTGVYKLHDGTDFAASRGTPVRAAADGTVSGRYFNAGYGNRVLVDHGKLSGSALTTTYNHLTRATVRAGQQVRRGEVLGYVGQSGYATGCHLHFMVVRDGAPVDPQGWL